MTHDWQNAPARARAVGFAERSLPVQNQNNSPHHYSCISLTFTLRSSIFYFFSRTDPGHDALTAGHLVAQTGHDRRWLPELTNGQALLTRGDPRTSLN
jgi:hypothetical protein